MDTTPDRAKRPRRGRRLVVAGVVLAFVATGGALTFVFFHRGSPAEASVTLEPADSSGPDPFTASVAITPVASFPEKVVAAAESTAASLPTDPATQTLVASGTTPGLYGGTGDKHVCNPQQLVTFLAQHPDKAAAWAKALGITPADVAGYVAKLTPVLLTSDTLVTNHGFRNGTANPLQSVLEAGTAVLVDSTGMPRVKCNCGNPLAPPDAISIPMATTRGKKWSRYSPKSVTVVHGGKAATSLTLLDVRTATTYQQAMSPKSPAPRTPTTKKAPIAPVDASIVGDYDITAGTKGSVTVHVSADHVTVSVATPFRLQGATCDLPASTVSATFTRGAPPHLGGSYSGFDPTTCVHGGEFNSGLDVNDNGSLTIGLGSSYLLTKTANAADVSSPTIGGDYDVTVGTSGSVTVTGSGGSYTVSVKAPFRLQGSACELPASTVIATFSRGAPPHLGGSYSGFDPTTCLHGGEFNSSLELNSDDSLTIGLGASYLLTKI